MVCSFLLGMIDLRMFSMFMIPMESKSRGVQADL